MEERSIPVEVWVKIFGFVNNAETLLALESCCKSFQTILKNDESYWKNCPRNKEEEFLECYNNYYCRRNETKYSERTDALLHVVIPRRLNFQNTNFQNIILQALGLKTWRNLFDFMWRNHLNDCTPGPYLEHDLIYLRGDTSATIMEIAEHWLISQLRRAQKKAIDRCNSEGQNRYPSLELEDWLWQRTKGHFPVPTENYFDFSWSHGMRLLSSESYAVSPPQKQKLFQLACHKAGVVMWGVTSTNWFDSEVFWDVVNVIIALIKIPALRLAFRHVGDLNDDDEEEEEEEEEEEKQELDYREGESMSDIPPRPTTKYISNWRGNQELRWVHTPTPKQIQDNAKRLGLPIVYGAGWHLHLESDDEDIFEDDDEGSLYSGCSSNMDYDCDEEDEKPVKENILHLREQQEIQMADAEAEYTIVGNGNDRKVDEELVPKKEYDWDYLDYLKQRDSES